MKTGRYIAVGNEWIKVSDSPPNLLPGIYWKDGGYFDSSARRTFTTKGEKRDWMRSHNLIEQGGNDGLLDNPWRGMSEAGVGKRHTRKGRIKNEKE